MAAHDDETKSHPDRRMSPGDAAFARLRQRETLKSKAFPPPEGPQTTTGDPSTGSSAMPKPATNSGSALEPSASRSDSGDESTPRILAVAAAFGFDVAPELLAPQSADADEGPADGNEAD